MNTETEVIIQYLRNVGHEMSETVLNMLIKQFTEFTETCIPLPRFIECLKIAKREIFG